MRKFNIHYIRFVWYFFVVAFTTTSCSFHHTEMVPHIPASRMPHTHSIFPNSFSIVISLSATFLFKHHNLNKFYVNRTKIQH